MSSFVYFGANGRRYTAKQHVGGTELRNGQNAQTMWLVRTSPSPPWLWESGSWPPPPQSSHRRHACPLFQIHVKIHAKVVHCKVGSSSMGHCDTFWKENYSFQNPPWMKNPPSTAYFFRKNSANKRHTWEACACKCPVVRLSKGFVNSPARVKQQSQPSCCAVPRVLTK